MSLSRIRCWLTCVVAVVVGALMASAAPALAAHPSQTHHAHAAHTAHGARKHARTGHGARKHAHKQAHIADFNAVSVEITSAPAASVAQTSARFTWQTTGPVKQTKCSVDAAAYASCSGSFSVSGLAAGRHTFKVEAIGSGARGSRRITDQAAWTVTTPVTPPVTTPVAPPVTTPVSTPSAPMQVGINEAGYGANGAADVASSFKIDRMDMSATDPASLFWSRGVAVDMDFSGPYNSGGVQALNPTAWAQNAVNTFQSECAGSVVNCPSLEVLNEPYGSWFWGANAEDAANEAAYAHLVVDTYTAFHNVYGSASPKVLAAFDDDSWWHGMQAAVPSIANYVDGVTVHAYGGATNAPVSALGARALVADAHQTTGKPISVTEFGWPTAVGQPATGDSMQWTFSQQATNTYNFVNWLRSLGYVSEAIDFNYQDYGTNDFYGVETSAGIKKPAWTALTEAANQQPCTVCS